jgi:uncharacterized integral membrane protein (TIGR00698 family)
MGGESLIKVVIFDFSSELIKHMKLIKYLSFFAIIGVLLSLNYLNFEYKHFLPGIALVLGIVLATIAYDASLSHQAKPWATQTLSYAIILLGFGFNLTHIILAGISGLGYTIISICGTLALGLLIGRVLNNQGKISTLISTGTAICGGSAIAAISPVIHAKTEETAVAMGVVFLLNAIGLLTFPYIGHHLHLTQHQFGLLAALAIHDTSSVVGSCMSYGQESLVVGTTVKLVRALWIIPVTLAIAMIYSRYYKQDETNGKIKKPWFILWFILASLLVTIFPQLQQIGDKLKHVGESLFIVALFLIGYNVSFKNLKAVGVSVLLQAIILWFIVSTLVIIVLKQGYLN